MTTEERKAKARQLHEDLKRLDNLQKLVAVEFSQLKNSEPWKCYQQSFETYLHENFTAANKTRKQRDLIYGYMTYLETAEA